MIKALLATFFTMGILSGVVVAQTQNDAIPGASNQSLFGGNEGKLFSLSWEPAGKDLKLKLVGKTAAEVKWNDYVVEIHYGLGDKKKVLPLVRRDDHYLISGPRPTEPLELRVFSRDGALTDRIEIPPRK